MIATTSGEPPTLARFTQAYRFCPLCDAEDIEYEFVIGGVAFARCPACTLLFANPPSPSQPTEPLGNADAAYPALRAFAERVLGRQARSVLVVDGAGAPADAHADRLPLTALDQRRYDLIVAFGVLDAVADPVAAAQTLRDHLEPDGVLLAAGPSISSREALRRRENWPPLRRRAGWYYDVDTLQLMLTRGGFGAFATIVDAGDAVRDPSPAARAFFGSHAAIVARPVDRPAQRLLSVIVPVYNEASTVAELLDRVLAKTIEGIEIEVLIVESNSTDGSRAIVQRYASHERVRVIYEERPRGKGHAVRTGLREARGEVVLFQDADLEYDVNDYDRLVAPLFGLRRNFVLGSRHDAVGGGWKIRQFEQRKAVAAAMNLAHVALLVMFNQLYRQSLFDPFTMYKVFRRDCLTGLSFECNRFDFDFEINIKLIRKGYRPQELLVNYKSRSFNEGKKVAFFRDPPTWIRAMLRLRRVPLYESLG
jgi:hypothetical protein